MITIMYQYVKDRGDLQVYLVEGLPQGIFGYISVNPLRRSFIVNPELETANSRLIELIVDELLQANRNSGGFRLEEY